MPVYNKELYKKDKHWKEGEFDVYRNMQWTGPGCHEGCGMLYYVKDGKIDHIEGDPNDEFSRGRLCMRCLGMVDEAINNPTRLGHPMKRTGKRGENKWEQITWDEAYDRIEEKGFAKPGLPKAPKQSLPWKAQVATLFGKFLCWNILHSRAPILVAAFFLETLATCRAVLHPLAFWVDLLSWTAASMIRAAMILPTTNTLKLFCNGDAMPL